jgi:hypothetical protein
LKNGRDAPTTKSGADEPKIRLQLFDCKGLTSDGFDSVLANEPDSGTEPEIWHQGQRPAAFWKKHEESRKKLHNCPANSFRI